MTSNLFKFLGVAALLGAGGVVTAKAVSKKADDNTGLPDAPPKGGTKGSSPPKSSTPKVPPGWSLGSFPLGVGQTKSMRVLQLQQALLRISPAAAAVLQKAGGADGAFGPGTSSALKAFGAPTTTTVSEALFQIIVNGNAGNGIPGVPNNAGQQLPSSAPVLPSTRTISASTIETMQEDMKEAVNEKLADVALGILARCKTPADYYALSDNGTGLLFSIFDGVQKSVVTKLLETFVGDDRFPAAFSMIGLQQGPDGKWYVPGMSSGLSGVMARRAGSETADPHDQW